MRVPLITLGSVCKGVRQLLLDFWELQRRIILFTVLAIGIMPLTLGWNFLGYLTINSWRVLIALACTVPMTGVILFSLISESPKFLLTKGYSEQTREVLQRMYSLNTGKDRNDFPVSNPNSHKLRLQDIPGAFNTMTDAIYILKVVE